MQITFSKNINNLKYDSSSKNNMTQFNGGLNPALKVRIGCMGHYNYFEKAFQKEYGITASFDKNDVMAKCCTFTANIFDHLNTKYKMGLSFPTTINVIDFNKVTYKEIRDGMKTGNAPVGLQIFDTTEILPGKIFPLRSLFFRSDIKDINCISNMADYNKKEGFWSTSHFLGIFIHEWCHNAHIDYLYRKFGYDGTCPIGLRMYNTKEGKQYDPNPYVKGTFEVKELQNKTFNEEQKQIIKKYVSGYAAGAITVEGKKAGGTPFELVAENMTNLIVESLHEYTLLPTYNPFGSKNSSRDVKLQKIFMNAWEGILL